jgi:hypothetical protein
MCKIHHVQLGSLIMGLWVVNLDHVMAHDIAAPPQHVRKADGAVSVLQ